MKKRIRILTKFMICFWVTFNLTGCWSAHELNRLAIVMGVGIDKSAGSDKMQMTVQIAKVSAIKSSGERGAGISPKAFINLTNTGATIFDAVKGYSRMASRRLFFSHNQVIIFGNAAAGGGIEKYIDFFLRNRETRLLVWVLVSKTSANDIFQMNTEFELSPSTQISALIKDQQKTSQIPAVDLRKFASRLMSKTSAPMAPMIEVSKDENRSIYLSDTAVFKKDRMVGQLNKSETRGVLWAVNEIRNGSITIGLPETEERVTMEITNAKGKMTPEINGDKVKIKIEIKEDGELGDQTDSKNLADPKAFEKLEKLSSEAIKREVLGAFKKSKELNADVFGFGDLIYQHYPKQWVSMEKNWDTIFQHITIDVSVEAKLRRTGRITKPIMSSEE